MAKKRHTILETVSFDSCAQAQDMVDRAGRTQLRLLIGLALSAAATVCTVLVLLGKADMSALVCPILLSLPAYLIGGGIGSALKAAKNIAVLGWVIVPFPVDILVGLVTLFYALAAFFFLPFFFVFLNFRKHSRDMKQARKFLRKYAQPACTE